MNDTADAHLTGQHYRIRPLFEGIVVGLSIFVVAILSTYFILHHALIAEKNEIRESMIRQAKIVATLINGDTHGQFTQAEQQQTPEYQRAIEPLARLLLESCDKRLDAFLDILAPENGCSLVFAYTVINHNNAPHYILDPWPEGIRLPTEDGSEGIEMKSYIMDKYDQANAVMLAALDVCIPFDDIETLERLGLLAELPAVEQASNCFPFDKTLPLVTDVYKDEWGHFISAYAPFYNSSGNMVGIVGIDMRAEQYLARLEPIKEAATRAFIVIGIIAYLVGAAIWFLRRFILIINEKRMRLLKSYPISSKSTTREN